MLIKHKPAAGPVLWYAGNAEGVPSLLGIPARDLFAEDLQALATHSFVRRRYGSSPDKLAAFLVGTGVYTDAASASAADADSGKESV
jgi:hypothetical protein